MLQDMRGLDPVSEQRRVMARTHLADIRRLDRDIKANKATIRRAVATAHTTVTDVYGVGPIVAAFLIGFTGDPLRFASADHYAAYNGTAPSRCPPPARHGTGCRCAATGDSTMPSTCTQIRAGCSLVREFDLDHPETWDLSYNDIRCNPYCRVDSGG